MQDSTIQFPTFSTGANHATFSDDRATYWFSYRTLIAFRRVGGDLRVRENVWGPTTGKHLNAVDGGNKRDRLTSDQFEQAYREDFGA
jgi:hypothetical protein